MRCFVDMDGVLVNLTGAACEFHGVENPYTKKENLGKYGIAELVGMSEDEFFGSLSADFWASLRPTKEWLAILHLVETKFGRENVCILTTPTDTSGCLEGKRRWIEKHLPEYRQNYFMGVKKEFVATPNSLLIDDSEANCKAFWDAGGLTFLYPRPWNTLHFRTRVGFYDLQFFLENLCLRP